MAPAYDLNPVPLDVRPRILSTGITLDSQEASLDLALEVAEHFGLNTLQAKKIAREVGEAVSNWDQEATQMGLSHKMIERMESAFVHRDSAAAKVLSR